MITVREAITIHSILIEKHGGLSGLRDEKLLISALNRPYQTFDGKDLYKNPHEKAAAIVESILINHPFVDGNKRFGYVAMRLILLNSKFDIKATQCEKYDFIINIAKGDLKTKQIIDSIENHIIKL